MSQKIKKSQEIIFRVDASEEIGAGHVMRCLTLADKLHSYGANIIFICKSQSGDLNEYIRKRGYEVAQLPGVPSKTGATLLLKNMALDLKNTVALLGNRRANWLIVDHYGLDASWENGMRPFCSKIMVIDDLANRTHDCDLLLDQNLRENAIQRYRRLVPQACRILAGPDHVLLNSKFTEIALRQRDGSVHNVVVYFGGNDITNQAGKAVEALKKILGLTVTVILGFSHPHRKAVFSSLSRDSRFNFMDSCEDMAGQMAKADLALGTCGISAWERCVLGLPTLVTVSAENQREDAEALHRLGAVEYLGDAEILVAQDWHNAIMRCLHSPEKVRKMGQMAQNVVAGHAENMQSLVSQLMSDHDY